MAWQRLEDGDVDGLVDGGAAVQ
uniref:Uncharacterized protein n=1 Tax=Arundo donax TaxID=35708 RepID=A0A0A9G2M4_ARUDO